MLYQQHLSLLGMFECMKSSWKIFVSLRGLHTTPHIILEISAFSSYMVMHAVHLRLEYGPEEQKALLSLQLTMHSIFLWAPHFQEIRLHCLQSQFQGKSPKIIRLWALPFLLLGGKRSLNDTDLWPVCPKWRWAFQNWLGKPPAFQQTSSGKMNTQRQDALRNPKKIARLLWPPLDAL